MKSDIPTKDLLTEVSVLIEQAKSTVVGQANYALTLLFWKIGQRVNEEILQSKWADYGNQIVVTLSRQLWLFNLSSVFCGSLSPEKHLSTRPLPISSLYRIRPCLPAPSKPFINRAIPKASTANC